MLQLTPVERYALSFLEFHQEPISQDELRQTEVLLAHFRYNNISYLG